MGSNRKLKRYFLCLTIGLCKVTSSFHLGGCSEVAFRIGVKWFLCFDRRLVFAFWPTGLPIKVRR